MANVWKFYNICWKTEVWSCCILKCKTRKQKLLIFYLDFNTQHSVTPSYSSFPTSVFLTTSGKKWHCVLFQRSKLSKLTGLLGRNVSDIDDWKVNQIKISTLKKKLQLLHCTAVLISVVIPICKFHKANTKKPQNFTSFKAQSPATFQYTCLLTQL